MDIPHSLFTLAGSSRLKNCLPRPCHSATVIFILLVLVQSTPVYAGLIVFNFLDPAIGAALDNNTAGELNIDELGASFETAMTAGYTSVFNQTSTRFGINTQGTSLDSSSLIDNVNGYPESLSLSFSERVKLEYLVLSLFSPAEKALLLFPDSLPQLLVGLDDALDVFNFGKILLDPGESIQLLHGQGNGFSLQSIAVRRISVDEPSTILFALGVITVLFLRVRYGRTM